MGLFSDMFREQEPSQLQPLTSLEELEAALDASHKSPVVLYKHSSMCATSLWQRREVEDFAKASDAVKVFEVVVQDSRAVSDEISSRLEVDHQTPQVIVVSKGHATYDRSHGQINHEDLDRAVSAEATSGA